MNNIFLEGSELYNAAKRTTINDFDTPLKQEVAKLLTHTGGVQGKTQFEKVYIKELLDDPNFKKLLPPELGRLMERIDIPTKQLKEGAAQIAAFIKESDVEQRKLFTQLLNEMRGTVKRKFIHQYSTKKIKEVGEAITDYLKKNPELIKDKIVELNFNPASETTTKFMNDMLLKLNVEATAEFKRSNAVEDGKKAKYFMDLTHANILWPQADYQIMGISGIEKYFRELLKLDTAMKRKISSYKNIKIDSENDDENIDESFFKMMVKSEIKKYVNNKGKNQESSALVDDFDDIAERMIDETPGLEGFIEKNFGTKDPVGELSTLLFQMYKKAGIGRPKEEE